MKNIFKFIFIIAVSSMLINCNLDDTDKTAVLSSKRTINLNKKNEIILRTGNDVIGLILDVKIYDHNILVTDRIFSKKCFYFNMDGQLLFTFGHKGEGPGEVPMLFTSCISGERVFVFGNYRLLIFNRINGKLIKTTKKPFRTICNNVYTGTNGTIYALSYNRYNQNRDSIYHIDKNGNLLNSFSRADDSIPKVFDTFSPQTGLNIDNGKIYQFFNYKYDISLFNREGKKLKKIKLQSPYYKKPDFKNAQNISGVKEEINFRSSFTQVSGIYKSSKGFVTILTSWKGAKKFVYILEFWDEFFNKIGVYELDEENSYIFFYNNMLVTIEQDQDEPKLEFWEITFQKKN